MSPIRTTTTRTTRTVRVPVRVTRVRKTIRITRRH